MKPKPSVEYIITSRPGMVPYARCRNLMLAQRESRRAQRSGLDGIIIRYVGGKRAE